MLLSSGAIIFIYYYGIGDRWTIAGLAIWFFAGIVAKIIKVPVYKGIVAIDVFGEDQLRKQRRRLNGGNLFQAALNSVAAVVMLMTFL